MKRSERAAPWIAAPALALAVACAGTGESRARSDAGDATRERQPAGDVWNYVLAHYDSDHDGRIVRSEYTRDDAHWIRLDKNGDGVVLADEVAIPPAGEGGRPWGEPSFDTTEPPKVGTWAPEFELDVLDGAGERVRLADFRGKKPVALVFGSYT